MYMVRSVLVSRAGRSSFRTSLDAISWIMKPFSSMAEVEMESILLISVTVRVPFLVV